MSPVRTSVMKLGALTATLLLLAGCSSGPSAAPTGETTEVTVTVQGMHYVPDVLEVPVGDTLVINFENTGTEVHDLVLENGKGSEHVAPGETAVIDAGVISEDMEGWCSVSNHRAMGMELTVLAVQ